MDKNDFFTYLELFYAEGLRTVHKKNADYTGEGDPFGNFRLAEQIGITSTGEAILVRMSDKLARLAKVTKNGAQVDESVRETCLDLANYAAILSAFVHHEQESVRSLPHPPDESSDGAELSPLHSEAPNT